MQANIKIERLEDRKFKIIWGEGPNSTLYLPEEEMLDFTFTINEAIRKMDDYNREIKTEQLAVSKLKTSKKIWSYKNGNIQIEWDNFLKKIPFDEFKESYKKLKSIQDELLRIQKEEKEAFEKNYKIVYKYFIIGMVSLFFSVACLSLLIVFIFFVRELVFAAFIVNVISWTFFAIFYFLQQKNVKNLFQFAGDNAGDTVLPMLSSIPNNRKIVEMLTIFFVIFFFMSIYFSKTIPKILNFYGNPGSMQNITD